MHRLRISNVSKMAIRNLSKLRVQAKSFNYEDYSFPLIMSTPFLFVFSSWLSLASSIDYTKDSTKFVDGYEDLEREISEMRNLAKNRKVDDYFTFGKQLGEGAYSKVFEATSNDENKIAVAVKALPKNYTNKETFWKEVAILKAAGDHPNVIKLIDAFETDTHFYLVTDIATGGELFEVLVRKGAYSEKQASFLLRQLTSALRHLHDRGIAHADIKPENLLLVDSNFDGSGIKLVDFGFSAAGCAGVKQQQLMISGAAGTYAYWAPEQFSTGEFGVKSDIWSFGVLMFIVLHGYHPFDPDGNASDEILKKNILAGKWEVNKNIPISDQAVTLLRLCLNPDPNLRITTEELSKHPWITGLDISDKPLDDSHRRLINYHNMRQRLKGNILAMLFQKLRRHTSNSTLNPTFSLQERRKSKPVKLDSNVTVIKNVDEELLSTTISELDPEMKGYITKEDVTRALPVSSKDATDILAAVSSDNIVGGGLSYKDLAALLTTIKKVTIEENHTVFKEGDLDDGFYIILNGDLEVTCRSMESGKHVIGTMSNGDFFGETEMVFGPASEIAVVRKNSVRMASFVGENVDIGATTEARHSTITCISPSCELLRLTRTDFQSLTSESQKAAQVLQQAALERSHTIFLSLLSDAIFGVKVTTLQPGEFLFQEGEDSSSVYFIKEGEIEVSKSNGGEKVVLALLTSDCYVGEMGVIQNRKRKASVMCKTGPCKIVEISKDSFMKVIHDRSVAESVKNAVHRKELENTAALNKKKRERY